MSSPPVSKQTPLPTSVTFGASARPQARSSSRGGSAAAAPTASIIGRFAARSAAAPRVTAHRRAVPRAERDEGRLQRLRPHVAGRRVDQVLRQRRRRRRSARAAAGVDALGADQLRAAAACPRGSGRSGSRPAASRAPRARRRARPPSAPARSARPAASPPRRPAWKRSRARAAGVPQPASAARSAAVRRRAGRAPRRARPRSPWPRPRRASPASWPSSQPGRLVGREHVQRNGPRIGRGDERHDGAFEASAAASLAAPAAPRYKAD